MLYAHEQLSRQNNPYAEVFGLPIPTDIWGDPIGRYIRGSWAINKELRAGYYSTLSRWIVTGILCRPQYEGPSFRGLKEDPNWEIDRTYQELGFMATSKYRKAAENRQYCSGVLVIIRYNNKGYDLTLPPKHSPKSGAPVIRQQAISGEGEVVFLPKTWFRVENIRFMPGVKNPNTMLKVYSVSVL